MKTEKKKYIKPIIRPTQVEMEQGIAAGSATVSSGSQGVDDWSDTGSTDKTLDM